jgi:hypothetical protein
MSHTGRKYYYSRMLNHLTQTGFPDQRPRQVTVEDITKDAILDGHEFEGEFQGNGVTVLTGLSTSQTFDVTDILNDNEKGVIIGYTTSSPYFQVFRNDGTGSKVVYTFPDKFKDDGFHVFKITVDSQLTVELDGAETVFTTRIPSINDTLYVINYSIY